MALADTFIRQVRHSGKPSGDKYADSGGMYLLVKAGGKYWRMDYRHGGKRKTLAIGVYPAVTLAKARKRRDETREQLADDIDPSIAKREKKLSTAVAAANTFDAVTLELLATKADTWTPRYSEKWIRGMKKTCFPTSGHCH